MPTARNIVVRGLAFVVALSVSASADAEEPEQEGPILTGETEVGVFAEQGKFADRALLSPTVRLGIRVRPEVELSIKGGAFGLFQNSAKGLEAEARPSNIVLRTRLLHERWTGRHFHFSGGFAFALPTAFSNTAVDDEAYDIVLGGRGGWNPWEWEPTSMGIFVPFALRGQVLRRLGLGVEAAGGGLFSSGGGEEQPALVAQIAGEVRYAFPWFAAQTRFQAVWNGRDERDRSQMSVVPGIDASFCRRETGRRVRGLVAKTSPQCPVYASAQFTFNIDRPYGFVADDAMRIWGLSLGLGWAL